MQHHFDRFTGAQVAITTAAAIAYLWNLTASGFGNTFYAAAAMASAQDPIAWLFGAWDPAGFITVDKPPLATMVMGLSVRLLGLSPWSVMLPQALAGIATVAVLMIIVRRTFGPAAAVIAGIVMATAPVTAVVFRYDNPDALLLLLLVLSAGALLRGLEDGRTRWLVAAAVLIGLAFNTKFLQAFLALPAMAVTWALFAPGSVRARLVALAKAGVALVIAAGWWVALVAAWPASARPYIGGSTTNSALDLLLGYDGFSRLLRLSTTDPNPGGEAGLLRLFNPQLGGQTGWLLPLASVALVGGLAIRRRVPRTDLRRAAYIFWGAWLGVHALVFSFMTGTIHPYYTVALVPAIAALAGGGLVDLWGASSRRGAWNRLALAIAIVGSAVLAAMLLDRSPDLLPGASMPVAAGGLLAAAMLVLSGRWTAIVRPAGVMLATVALLTGPIAYSVATLGSTYSGGDPMAGPRIANAAATGLAATGGGGSAGSSATTVASTSSTATQYLPLGFTKGGQDRYPDQVLLDYLVANRGTSTWMVAVTSSDDDGPLELESGLPVMAMGGFKGYDPAPTVDELAAYTSSGRLRFVIVSGGRGDATAARDAWVTSHCTVVDFGEGLDGSSLYDCAAAAG